MTNNNWNRRDFSKWSVAALGGLVSGTAIGCGGAGTETPAPGGTTADGDASTDPSGDAATTEVAAHACRGLNDCKSANNDCRGQGACGTKAWHHACADLNDCKGQGGCGDNPLANDCKEKGHCAVPLMDSAWDKARAGMETKWKTAEQEFGTAPAKAG